MLSRSLTMLAGSKPPFSVFYKSISGKLTRTAAPDRMRVASALWRRTSPQYGIYYSAPRLAEATRLYKMETDKAVGSSAKKLSTAKRTPAKAAKSPRKAPAKAKRVAKSKKSKKSPVKQSNPYNSFKAKVLKETKLPPTAATRQRIFRMWVMTAQQSHLTTAGRVSMAVRLLNKGSKKTPKLSKKLKKQKRAVSSKARRSSKKAATAGKKKTRSATKTKAAKKPKSRKPRKPAAAKKKSKARKTAHRLAAKAKARKAKSKRAAKPRKSAGKSKGRRAVAKKAKSTVATSRGQNPYVEFYRRVRMTGLLPNGPKVTGSRVIKKLWARTHSLPTIDARVAQATKLLEKQMGVKASPVVASTSEPTTNTPARSPAKKALAAVKAAAASTPALASSRNIEIPSNYLEDPFGATYVALLPMLQTVPQTTRMAHVAKAWSATERQGDTRSPKQRVAAVVEELEKRLPGHSL